MRVENIASENIGNRARISATVSWEDCERPRQEVFIETDEKFAESISPNPHAFLLACIIPAFHYGEKRISIDGEICPELREGLTTAMSLLRHWFYDPNVDLVEIEGKTRSCLPSPRTADRAGFFYSGGIDSLATFRSNQLAFPRQHPWAMRDGILVCGLEIEEEVIFGYVKDSLSQLAGHAGITLLPVYTNLYLIYRQEDKSQMFRFWTNEFQGAAFSAIAHAFSRRLTVMSIAGSSEVRHLEPSGTHPLLDPYYSSADLRIRHDGVTHSRLDKTRLMAEWDVALRFLRVCNLTQQYRPGMLNCGRCAKCVKTMLCLAALGVMDKATSFPEQHISADRVKRGALIYDSYTESNYRELMPLLAGQGRHDLVQAVESLITRYRSESPRWKRWISRADQKYLNGRLRRLKASLMERNPV